MDPVVAMMTLTIGVTLAIGVHAYWSARTQQEYFAYGQQLRWFVLGLATYSTIMSGFGFVGGPGRLPRWARKTSLMGVPSKPWALRSWFIRNRR